MTDPSTHPARTVSRRGLLRGAALGSLALTGAGSSVLAGGVPAAGAPVVTKIKNLVGTQTPVQYGIGATDLGIPVRTPDGRVLYTFGDTFGGATVGSENWRSPVGLYSSTTDLAAGITFNGAVGGSVAKQYWPYVHGTDISTVIPSDVITIGGTMYLHAIVNGPSFGRVRRTEIWRSDDNGQNWSYAGLTFPGDKDGGFFQCITWAQGSDGFVYIYATGFQRDKGVILYRVPAARITDGAAYQPWGWNGSAWGWGNPATPIVDGRFGEMCLRPIGGKWVFTWFNEADYRVDAMVLNTPTDDLYTAPRTTLIRGGQWGAETDTSVAQLYGPYVVPGSTLSDLHLTLSQWNTATNDVYHSMQFRVRGLA